MAAKSEWAKLPLSLAELCIDTTLRCGQSFRWQQINNEWLCTLHGRVVALKQDESHLHYRVTWPQATKGQLKQQIPTALKGPTNKETVASPTGKHDDTEALLKNYFNLHLDLTQLYAQWSRDDANFRKKAPHFNGIRILNQDAWEALVAFICSSNNNISRISQMVHKLCRYYGPFIARIEEQDFHDFPAPEALTGADVESHLRELGFGYRARYITETARMVAGHPAGWLLALRNPQSRALLSSAAPLNPSATYKTAHEQMLTLSGVGPKVADCVCLMGLGWGEAVPVDTHVWQIAVRDYKFGGKGGKTSTLSKGMHDAVGDHFRSLWGQYAGWAQSVVFTANLKSFSDRLSTKTDSDAITIKTEIEEVKAEFDGVKTEAKIEVTSVTQLPGKAVTSRKRRAVVRKIEADLLITGGRETRASKRRRTAGVST